MTKEFFQSIILVWIAIGLVVFLVLLYIPAPYGRHSKRNWGPMIPNRLAWLIMEFPSLLLFVLLYLLGPEKPQSLAWLFFAIYVLHYANRSLIYPFRTRTRGKQMPLVIAIFAIIFNLVNGSLNGYYFSAFSRVYDLAWLKDARFILGSIVFATGVIVNLRSDRYLLRLRRHSANTYQIPRGKLFEYVSCPNFFGEILEWSGFAIMTWSPAALAFALWTIFNLLPRALEHHKWYKKEFPDYPAKRKAVIPFLV